MAGEYNRFARNARLDVAPNTDSMPGDTFTLAPETPDELADRQARNLAQWQQSYAEYRNDPKKQAVLRSELERGRGTDFPGKGGGFQMTLTEAPAAPEPTGFKMRLTDAPAANEDFLSPQMPPAVRDQTQAETPGGAVTGRARVPRARGEVSSPLSGPAARVATETAGSVLGEVVGGRVAGPAGAMAGSALGGGAGSTVAEAFDPTTSPVRTAVEAGLAAATGTMVGTGAVAGIRKAIGNPTEAGKRLLKIAEARGEVPLPGAVMDEASLAAKIQAIGQADVFTGQRVADKIKATGGMVTQDVGQYVHDALRTKGLANKSFAVWDEAAGRAFGNNRVVYLPPTTLDVLEPIIKVWESRGLAQQFDPTLLRASKAIRAQLDAAAATGGRPTAIKLSLGEAEAVRSAIYNNARSRTGAPSTGLSEIGGEDLAKAYRKEAGVVADHIENAINAGVKDGRMPAAARADLQGAKDLWKQWKQGEEVLDALTPALQSAQREARPLTSQEIFSALQKIGAQEEKFSRNLVSGQQKAILTGFARALEANEKSGQSKMFTWMIRGNQANLVIGGGIAGGVAGGPLGATLGAATVALTPTVMNWLVTNKTAATLLIRGLRTNPGTAEAARAGRQFLTLGMKEGVFPPDRQFTDEEAAISGAREPAFERARPELQ